MASPAPLQRQTENLQIQIRSHQSVAFVLSFALVSVLPDGGRCRSCGSAADPAAKTLRQISMLSGSRIRRRNRGPDPPPIHRQIRPVKIPARLQPDSRDRRYGYLPADPVSDPVRIHSANRPADPASDPVTDPPEPTAGRLADPPCGSDRLRQPLHRGAAEIRHVVGQGRIDSAS
jgi:hypothetical protein